MRRESSCRLIFMAVCPLLCLSVSSCRTARDGGQALNTEHVHDTVTVWRWRDIKEKDSVHVSDSTAVEYKAGVLDSGTGVRADTLRERRWHKETRTREVTDRNAVSKTAYRTIVKTATRTITKETGLTRWQRFLMRTGGVSCLLLMILFIFVIVKRVKKRMTD